MDEDRLSPEFGRLIDAAKAVAGADAARPRDPAEGWALLADDGNVYAAADLDSARAAARRSADEREGVAGMAMGTIVAAAFAVAGAQGETLLPRGGWRSAAEGLDPELPVAVKYLGRWVVVTLSELPAA